MIVSKVRNPEVAETGQAGPMVYVALFLVALSTLLLELGLTRIFSVIVYYHMAFFAVSVTMFGLAFGGVIVHFLPRVFTAETAPRWMFCFTLAYALAVLGALAVLLAIPFDVTRNRVLVPQLILAAVALATPFTCGGVVVALALTRFPRRTNLLYGWDLAGAALGCLLYAPMIYALGGSGLMLWIAVILAAGALLLALGRLGGRSIAVALIVTLGVTAVAWRGDALEWFRIRNVRGFVEDPSWFSWTGWNLMSRICVSTEMKTEGEGMAPEFYDLGHDPAYMAVIDTLAATPILKTDGKNFADFKYPFHDVSYPAHVLRRDASVAIIGVGGGRDVIAALAWGQRDVTGIEINGRIIEAFSEVFADYNGHPLTWPGFTLVNDEARSFITRSEKHYDIIQASLIDTFAATAAGAFVLTENSLYTLEGWDVFLSHLKPNGILTMSRWYTEEMPVESVRLLALARGALEQRGIADARGHILMARTPRPVYQSAQPLATILVSPQPFSEQDIDRFEAWVRDNKLIALISPRGNADALLGRVLDAPKLEEFLDSYQFEVSPPTDVRPFFFDVLRWRDIFSSQARQGSDYIYSINLKPVVMLGTLLITVILLAGGLVVIPLLIEQRRTGNSWHSVPAGARGGMVVFFMMLGLGYMLVELALIQRLSLFLGHPSYSLTVCLFTMLLASGLGSMLAPRVLACFGAGEGAWRLRKLLIGLVMVLTCTLFIGEWCIRELIVLSTPLRILVAGVLIFPGAFVMGMPLALGIQLAARRGDAPLAWFWGVNSSFSVCASVFTVALAHSTGLHGSFVCGIACYGVAALSSASFRITGSDKNEGMTGNLGLNRG